MLSLSIPTNGVDSSVTGCSAADVVEGFGCAVASLVPEEASPQLSSCWTSATLSFVDYLLKGQPKQQCREMEQYRLRLSKETIRETLSLFLLGDSPEHSNNPSQEIQCHCCRHPGNRASQKCFYLFFILDSSDQKTTRRCDLDTLHRKHTEIILFTV
jgi:hypothetical protein